MNKFYSDKTFITFDDVLLVPNHSDLESRSEADLSTVIGGLKLKIPVLSANMDTVTECNMALTIGRLGGVGILHRYADAETVSNWIEYLRKTDPNCPIVPSIGIQDKDKQVAELYRELGILSVCVDVAHGHSKRTGEMVKHCKSLGYNTIIAGNVATGEGALFLADAGAHAIKVGVGGGSACTTRGVTGHGVPQLSAILDVSMTRNHNKVNFKIIADGGMRSSADAVKALAAGADGLMFGNMFAATNESPGEEVVNSSGKLKTFRGMASREAQEAFRGSVGNGTPEGVATYLPHRGSVVPIVENLCGGIRSGFSYSGARNLQEFHEYSRFVKVSSNTVHENYPHTLHKGKQ